MKIYKAIPPNFGFYFVAHNKWWWVGKSRSIVEVSTNMTITGLESEIGRVMEPSNSLEFLVMMGATIDQAVETVLR